MKFSSRIEGPCASRKLCYTLIILIQLSNHLILGQMFWLYTQPSSNLNYGLESNLLGSETQLTEVANKPSYYMSHFHNQAYNGPFLRPSFGNSLPQIVPLLMTQYGSSYVESGGVSKSPPWLQLVSNRLDDSETVFGTIQNKNVNYGDGKREYEDDMNGSGEEFEVDSLRQHHQFHKFIPFASEQEMRIPSSISKNVVITHAEQRCIQKGHQARFDPITGGCYTVGTKGPCGDFMIFTSLPNSSLNGYCDCDYDSFDRPMVAVGGKCEFLYTQAMCYPGFWLTSVTSANEPVCQSNPCQYFNPDSVLFKGECVQLNSPSRHCPREGEVVLFPKGSSKLACGFPKSRIHRRQISNVGRFVCAPGMRRHRITKKCIRTRAIVFH